MDGWPTKGGGKPMDADRVRLANMEIFGLCSAVDVFLWYDADYREQKLCKLHTDVYLSAMSGHLHDCLLIIFT